MTYLILDKDSWLSDVHNSHYHNKSKRSVNKSDQNISNILSHPSSGGYNPSFYKSDRGFCYVIPVSSVDSTNSLYSRQMFYPPCITNVLTFCNVLWECVSGDEVFVMHLHFFCSVSYSALANNDNESKHLIKKHVLMIYLLLERVFGMRHFEFVLMIK